LGHAMPRTALRLVLHCSKGSRQDAMSARVIRCGGQVPAVAESPRRANAKN
jgi:hypothetical protein